MPTVTTATSLIVAVNPRRISLIITRADGGILFLDKDDSLTTATGIHVFANSVYTEDSGARQMYLGPIYGIVASTTSLTLDVRYWERQS